MRMKNVINLIDVNAWVADKDNLLDLERAFRRQGSVFCGGSVSKESMFRYLMFKQYSATYRFPYEMQFDDIHFIYCYLFDFNFACMLHFHIGSAYRTFVFPTHDQINHVVCPFKSVRCNTTSGNLQCGLLPATDLAAAMATIHYQSNGDLVLSARRSYQGAMDWSQFNWHRLYQLRHSELIVPHAYWNHIETVAWISDEISASYDYCRGSLSLYRIHHTGHGQSDFQPSCTPVRDRNAELGADGMYMWLLTKHLFLSPDVAGDAASLLHEDSNFFRARIDLEHESRFSRTTSINGAEDLLTTGTISLNGVTYTMTRRLNLRSMYNSFKEEFDFHRPHLKHLQSYFLDDVS
jgi:hypothetical protein